MSYIQKRGQNTSWRNSLMRNLVSELVKNGKLEITLTRAKELRKLADKIITIAKKDTVHARREANKILRPIKVDNNKNVLDKLFSEIAPKYKTRNGGYTRIIKTDTRRGDNTQMAIIQWV